MRIFNTWLGDPGKIILLEGIMDVIRRENLLEEVVSVGKVLEDGLNDLEKKYSNIINSSRGRGTFRAFNGSTTEVRNQITSKLKLKGKIIYLFHFI